MKKTFLIAFFVFTSLLLIFTACTETSPAASTVCGYSFGYNQDDDNTSLSAEFLFGHDFVMSADVTISKLSVKLESASDYIIGIYTDNSGSPGTLLSQTEIKSGTIGWNTASIPATALVSGSKYWLVSCSDSSSIKCNSTSDTGLKYGYYPWSDIVTNNGMPSSYSSWITDVNGGDVKMYAMSCN
ncbi:MAG: hypothetical protein JXR81_00310 [Candidatus Goldbacteria bacterium]|nr:hypothetical protein [Candidatus Goldiibacteriota bacterium]